MRDIDKKKWRRVISALKREFPAQRPVKVRTSRLKNAEASTVTGPTGSTIYISSALNFSAAFDALAHEYSHVLDSHERFADHDSQHGETWGVWYSRVYRAMLRVVEDKQ